MKIIQIFKLLIEEYQFSLYNENITFSEINSEDGNVFSPWENFSVLFFAFIFFELIIFGLK